MPLTSRRSSQQEPAGALGMQPGIARSMPAHDSVRTLGVDLDGTLLATDALWESLLLLLKHHPLAAFLCPVWILRGKAFFKRKVAERTSLNPVLLPYRPDVLAFIEQEKRAGKELVLASASDERIVQRVADHVGLFSTVLASDGVTNLSGPNKLRALARHTRGGPFDYIGNSRHDLPLWRAARQAILVDPSARLLQQARNVSSSEPIVIQAASRMPVLLKALRLHQWVKNILLFVPLILAHRVTEIALVLKGGLAFLVFSLCASGCYILNDLLNLEEDRQHPGKRGRPFASGALPIPAGIGLASALLSASLLMSLLLLPYLFTGVLAAYMVMAISYSVYFRQKLILDVLVLAGFYTLRIFAGAIAVGVSVSAWLLSFSMFLFLSLAFLKRYTELRLMEEGQTTFHSGRGYVLSDIVLIQNIGPTSGYLSVLVLALYINSRDVVPLYHHPELLWLIGPCLLYWITRMWFLAYRGQMADDPILFAMRDSKSYLVGFAAMILVLLATR